MLFSNSVFAKSANVYFDEHRCYYTDLGISNIMQVLWIVTSLTKARNHFSFGSKHAEKFEQALKATEYYVIIVLWLNCVIKPATADSIEHLENKQTSMGIHSNVHARSHLPPLEDEISDLETPQPTTT